MKNTTLLKVLSASAIFTAIAAIESYDHNAFATEVTATANNTQSDVETKTVPQDVKNGTAPKKLDKIFSYFCLVF